MRYIDQEKIYDTTDKGLSIFQHYFPGVDLTNNKTFFKARDGEKTPSARISWYQGSYRITDFGNQNELNGAKAIEFVMWRESLPYYDALLFIEEVILNKRIEGSGFSKTVFQAEYAQREMEPGDKKGEYKFVFKKEASADDLQAIGRYVTQDILDRFNCRVVEQYELCNYSKKLKKDVVHIFKSNKDYPIFLFDYGTFKKLYRPHEVEKRYRFLYIGDKPKDYIYGLQLVEDADNEFVDDESGEVNLPEGKEYAKVIDLFRCSGESDALNLASLGFHVYWLNSETAELDYVSWKKIDNLCQNHYQIMDLDRTGQDQALKNALKHIDLYTIELPKWLAYKRDWRGNPCKDLKDFINLAGNDEDSTSFEFLVLKRAARRVRFWDKNVDQKTKKVSYSINMEFFFFFLKANGFYQMESVYHKKAGYCYVKLDGKVAHLIHPDDIKRLVKRFTKDWVKSRKLMDSISILNKINTSAQMTEGNIESIDMIELNFKNHDRAAEYIHFRNGSIQVKPSEIKRVPHSDLPNYILGSLDVSNKKISHLIDRDIRVHDKPAVDVQPTVAFAELSKNLEACTSEAEREKLNAELSLMADTDKYTVTVNDDEFIFTRFLRDLARIHWRKELYDEKPLDELEKKEQNLALVNLMFVLGFHAAQYKDPGKPWLTFLQDNRISDIGQASGRSGKSLLSKATTYVRASFYKGGRVLNDKAQYQFFYDGLTEFHDYIEIDDMHEYADFGFFYTQVTGKREVNPKNYTPITLDYEDSGKMLISSNFELQNVDSSTVGRLLNCSVSDYYHEMTKYNDYKESRSPLTKFGRRIYDDFTDEEWIKFYNFIAYCIQLQMRFHKIQPPAGNIEKRQLRRVMSQGLGKDEEFFRWANDYFMPKPSGYEDQYSIIENGYFDTKILRDNAFENFTATLTPKQRHEYKSGKFKKHLEAWCEYHDHELNPESECTDLNNRRILKTIDGKTREVIYLRSNGLKAGNRQQSTPLPPDDQLPF
ncbi:MAG: hypothetical protein PF694_09135 [Bacteroidetes bacterium]|jgi:hypothetical protein|nr:hypothetical protein [Bacteroidota bacterium]